MARPAKFDDDEILERAMRAFWHHGLSNTSIRDLEAELELKAPSIYRRFDSKDGLALAVLERYLAQVIERRIQRHLSGVGDPIDNIRSFLESAVTSTSGEPLVGCLLTTASLEAGVLDHRVRDVVQEGLRRIERAICAEVQRAAVLGRLAVGLDADAAAIVVGLGMQGLMVLARSGRPSEELLARVDALVASIERTAPEAVR